MPRGDKKVYKIQEWKKDRYHKEEETISTKEQQRGDSTDFRNGKKEVENKET